MSTIKKRVVDYFHRESTVRFQVATQLTTLLILVFLGRIPLSEDVLNFADPKPELEYFTPQEQAGATTAAAKVKTGIYVKDFPEFDPVKNVFVIDAIIWFEFEPHAISLDIVDKFSFKRGEILKKSPPNTTIIKDKLFASYDVKLKFSSNLNFQNFPFNDHRIYLVLTNEFVTPDEFRYIGYESGISVAQEIYTGGWINVGSTIEYGYNIVQFEEDNPQNTVSRPTTIFSIDYSQTGVKNVFLILIPILLMYFMAFFSLSMNIKKHTRIIMQLSIGAITALLAYRFVIERLSPDVGYFVISDYIYLYILITVFIVFLLNMYAVRVAGKLPFTIKVARSVITLVSHLLLIVLFYYLLFAWGK